MYLLSLYQHGLLRCACKLVGRLVVRLDGLTKRIHHNPIRFRNFFRWSFSFKIGLIQFILTNQFHQSLIARRQILGVTRVERERRIA